jgi:hypothetical protein
MGFNFLLHHNLTLPHEADEGRMATSATTRSYKRITAWGAGSPSLISPCSYSALKALTPNNLSAADTRSTFCDFHSICVVQLMTIEIKTQEIIPY